MKVNKDRLLKELDILYGKYPYGLRTWRIIFWFLYSGNGDVIKKWIKSK